MNYLCLFLLILTRVAKKRQDAPARQSQIEGSKAPVLIEEHHCQRQGRRGRSIWQSRSQQVVSFLTVGLVISFRLDATIFYEGTQTFRNYGQVGYNFLVQFLPYNPTILEAGAYRGEQTAYAAQTWPHHSSILAFEPNPVAFETLRKKVEGLEKVHVYNLALNAYNGEADLFIPDLHEADSSLLPPTEEMSAYYQGSKVQVPCVVLDDWCDQNQIESLDILRLELEGLELKVLEGASKILKNTKIIIVQSFFRPYRVDMCNYFSLKDLLVNAHFVPLAHWYEQGERGVAVYVSQEMFDAYFVKCLGLGLGGLLYP